MKIKRKINFLNISATEKRMKGKQKTNKNHLLLVNLSVLRCLSVISNYINFVIDFRFHNATKAFLPHCLYDIILQIVVEWVKEVTYQRGLPKKYLKFASGTILTYGSYGLGVSLIP